MGQFISLIDYHVIDVSGRETDRYVECAVTFLGRNPHYLQVIFS